MWYLGGKMRQSREIVQAVTDLHPNFKVYVEPFCGALWSACAVMRAFPGRKIVINDINPYLIKMWKAGRDGWDPPKLPTERDYHHYNRTRPLNDPMTGYLGFAWSFGGKFFGGPARSDGKFKGSWASTVQKIELLRQNEVEFSVGSYDKVLVPNKAMVYLDPPYQGRTAQSKSNGELNRKDYFNYANRISKRAVVIATEFVNEPNWPVLHNYGDTVVRHLNAKPKDGTVELLLRVLDR